MGIISELPVDLVEKIAAGEVVERPASVVKELIENSIDAGASRIKIVIRGGGRGLISVEDDGCGMGRDDLAKCVLKHATSKIRSESDLWNLHTLGFRGEALAAIGAVSEMEIESRPASEALEGSHIILSFGAADGPHPAGCPSGTRVSVKKLFGNVPARMKFLKSDAVEFGHVHDSVVALALANPSVRFDLSCDGKERLCAHAADFADDDAMKSRIISLVGDSVSAGLKKIYEPAPEISVEGWVSENGRRGGKDIHIFLNGRPVRDRLLIHAVTSALGDGTLRDRYPAAILWMRIDPSKVDVNVHPTKREVRFANSGAVYEFLKSAMRKGLQSGFPTSAGSVRFPGVENAIMRFEERRECQPLRGFSNFASGEKRNLEHRDLFFTSQDLPRLRPIGQLGLSYILCEDENRSLVVIDQHAAHERLGFEALKNQRSRGGVAGQRLLIPERVELSPKELAHVMEHFGALSEAGFEIEHFGGNSVVVKSVPEMLAGISLAGFLSDLASDLEELGASSSADDAVNRILTRIACHSQIRSGDRLSDAEVAALVHDVVRERVTHCPHGRPALVKIDPQEIEKWFKRD
ncbi:MAG TPA: DNA mismatch repair endonuclease MutL [bacterium]|nr:DNA mismatch repair endonuclease MutL [bacterium]